jgi:hypothetical protein
VLATKWIGGSATLGAVARFLAIFAVKSQGPTFNGGRVKLASEKMNIVFAALHSFNLVTQAII